MANYLTDECVHLGCPGCDDVCTPTSCQYYCPCEESLEFDEDFDANAREEFYDDWFQYLETYYTEY